MVRQIFGGVRARAALSGVELAIDAWRPHVVLRESCEFAGAVAAESREIPHARVGVGLAQTEDYVDPHRGPDGRRAARVGRARARPGGPQARRDALPHADARRRSRRRAARCPSASCASTTPRRGRTRRRDPDAQPLVYVTFGTVAASLGLFPGFYRSVIEALAGLPVRIVMTVGDAADEAELGSLPAQRQRQALDPAGRDPRQGERDGRPRRVRDDDGRAAGRRAAGRGAAVRRPALQRARGSRASASAWSPRRRTPARSAPRSSACSPSRRSAASRHGWPASRSPSPRSTRSSPRCSSSSRARASGGRPRRSRLDRRTSTAGWVGTGSNAPSFCESGQFGGQARRNSRL